jgi:uncharacterized membrane protein YozB (DUF420 family)
MHNANSCLFFCLFILVYLIKIGCGINFFSCAGILKRSFVILKIRNAMLSIFFYNSKLSVFVCFIKYRMRGQIWMLQVLLIPLLNG